MGWRRAGVGATIQIVNVPILVNCECGHTTSAIAGEEVSCNCGRQYATELSAQQVAALHAMNQQMRVFARLGVGLTGLLSLLALTVVNVYAGLAAFVLGVVGWWVVLQPLWRRHAVTRLAGLPPASVSPK
jgi:hypothetical protein